MEALGKYDAGGRAERGNEGAREESTRIALPMLCSPSCIREPKGGQGYSHIISALAATIPPSLFGDTTTLYKLLDGVHFRLQPSGIREIKKRTAFPVHVKVTSWLGKMLDQEQKATIN